MRAYFVGAAVAAMAAVGMGSAVAAPPAPVVPSIALASIDGVQATATPSLGQSIAFATTYSRSSYKNPRIVAACYQAGVMVWANLGTVDETYKLGGDASPWLNNGGGAANCQAELVNLTWVKKMETRQTLASMTFDASA